MFITLDKTSSTALNGASQQHSGKESAGNAEDPGLIPGQERFPGEGNGYTLQYSCLENPMDREAWWATGLWGHKESDMTEQLTHYNTQKLDYQF